MSLLLDALKRAEQAKLAKQGVKGAPTSNVAAQPAVTAGDVTPPPPPATPVATPLPTPAAPALQEVEAPQTAPAGAAQQQDQRDTAKNVFSAKLPLAALRQKWILPAAALALLVVAGGGYVWNEISRLGRPATVATATAPSQTAPIPITQASRETLPPAKPETGQLTGAAPTPNGAPPPAVAMKNAVVLPERVASVKLSGERSANDALINSLKESQTANDSPVVLKLSKVIDAPRVSTELAGAYEALKSGDYGKAKRLYAVVLQGDALSLDAHLGMATALARAGDTASAARAYRKALEIDPRNGTALAGLLSVSNSSPSGALEVELRNLLANNPKSAAVSFSLGNLYAAQSRWTEAQQVYFEAFRIEPENADYIYNLAVSLDQLKQPQIALDYYQRALVAAGKAGAQFDPAQVRRRVIELRLVEKSSG